jgi:hypothetical protein
MLPQKDGAVRIPIRLSGVIGTCDVIFAGMWYDIAIKARNAFSGFFTVIAASNSILFVAPSISRYRSAATDRSSKAVVTFGSLQRHGGECRQGFAILVLQALKDEIWHGRGCGYRDRCRHGWCRC